MAARTSAVSESSTHVSSRERTAALGTVHAGVDCGQLARTHGDRHGAGHFPAGDVRPVDDARRVARHSRRGTSGLRRSGRQRWIRCLRRARESGGARLTTSLARAITRAYAAIWSLPRLRSNPRDAWRWLLAVVAMAVTVVGVQILVREAIQAATPIIATSLLTSVIDTALALFLPWILTAGRIPARWLVPGAVSFAVVMLAIDRGTDRPGRRIKASATRLSPIFFNSRPLGSQKMSTGRSQPPGRAVRVRTGRRWS